ELPVSISNLRIPQTLTLHQCFGPAITPARACPNCRLPLSNPRIPHTLTLYQCFGPTFTRAALARSAGSLSNPRIHKHSLFNNVLDRPGLGTAAGVYSTFVARRRFAPTRLGRRPRSIRASREDLTLTTLMSRFLAPGSALALLLVFAPLPGHSAIAPPQQSGQARQRPAKSFPFTETSLGKKPAGFVDHSLVLSPDGNHLAYVAGQGSTKVVVLDGHPGKPYPDIPEQTLTERGRDPQIRF